MRILLADDNNEIRAALRLLLEEFGQNDILEATDQAQTLAAAERGPLDVVLLDWELPPSDPGGYGAAAYGDRLKPLGTAGLVQELRRRVMECRIIAMSGRPEAREASLRDGCDDFISRNEPPDRLLTLLHIGGRTS